MSMALSLPYRAPCAAHSWAAASNSRHGEASAPSVCRWCQADSPSMHSASWLSRASSHRAWPWCGSRLCSWVRSMALVGTEEAGSVAEPRPGLPAVEEEKGMVWWQMAGLVLGSLALLGVSWRTLKNLRSHGFYRFLAWEVMLLLLVLNAPVWFEDRYALH